MNLLEFYNVLKSRFPEATTSANREYIRQWDEKKTDGKAYSWFESLAKVINQDVESSTEATRYQALLEFISSTYESSEPEVRNCIHVSFIEHLFWKTCRDKTEPYWCILPKNLKDLYLSLHGKAPV